MAIDRHRCSRLRFVQKLSDFASKTLTTPVSRRVKSFYYNKTSAVTFLRHRKSLNKHKNLRKVQLIDYY